MPTIKTYTADLGGVPSAAGRRASPDDFGAGVAEAVGGLARTAAGVADAMLRQQETEDARSMLTGIAQLNAKYSTAQQEAISSGADLEKLRDKYTEELAQLRGNSTTRHGAATFDYQEATALQAFDMRGLQIRAQRAGAKARQDSEQFASALGQQVFNDPSSLPYLDRAINDFAANLPEGTPTWLRDELKQELVWRLNSDAVRGSLHIDAKQTLKDLESGKFSLKPGQLPQEIARARAQIDAEADQEWVRKQRRREEFRQQSEAVTDVYLRQVFDNKMDPKVVNLDEKLTPEHRKALITFNRQWWDSIEGGGRKSNPRVMNDLMLRVYAEDGDPNKVMTNLPILQAVERNELNPRDARWLMTAVAEQRDPNNTSFGQQFGQMARLVQDAFLNDRRYNMTPDGRIKAAGIVNAWLADVRRRADERRKTGKPLGALFDPNSADYVGHPNYIKRFENEAAKVPTVTSQEERDRLPPGTIYQDPQGNVYQKPGLGTGQLPGMIPN